MSTLQQDVDLGKFWDLGAIIPEQAQRLLKKAFLDGVTVRRIEAAHWECTGSKGAIYDQYFITSGGHFYGRCTCPARTACKHLALAARAWKQDIVAARKGLVTKTQEDFDREAEEAIAQAERHITEAQQPAQPTQPTQLKETDFERAEGEFLIALAAYERAMKLALQIERRYHAKKERYEDLLAELLPPQKTCPDCKGKAGTGEQGRCKSCQLAKDEADVFGEVA
jgi:hypothetical protein